MNRTGTLAPSRAQQLRSATSGLSRGWTHRIGCSTGSSRERPMPVDHVGRRTVCRTTACRSLSMSDRPAVRVWPRPPLCTKRARPELVEQLAVHIGLHPRHLELSRVVHGNVDDVRRRRKHCHRNKDLGPLHVVPSSRTEIRPVHQTKRMGRHSCQQRRRRREAGGRLVRGDAIQVLMAAEVDLTVDEGRRRVESVIEGIGREHFQCRTCAQDDGRAFPAGHVHPAGGRHR